MENNVYRACIIIIIIITIISINIVVFASIIIFTYTENVIKNKT